MLFYFLGLLVMPFVAYLTGVTSVSITPRIKGYEDVSSESEELASESEGEKKKPITRSGKALEPYRARIKKLRAIERKKRKNPATRDFSNLSDSVILLSSPIVDIVSSIAVGIVFSLLTCNTASIYNFIKAIFLTFSIWSKGEDRMVLADGLTIFVIIIFSAILSGLFYKIRVKTIIRVTKNYIGKYVAIAKRPLVKEQESFLEIAISSARKIKKRVIWAAREVSKEQKVSRAEPKCA